MNTITIMKRRPVNLGKITRVNKTLMVTQISPSLKHVLLLRTNCSNVPHLHCSYRHASVLLSMVSIKVNCMVTLPVDKRYYALYNDWCMDSQSHSIKGIGTMHSMTGTWILNLTFMIGRGTMHSTMTNTWILNHTFITGRGTMHSTMTGSVTWILNLTFTVGAVLSLGTTMSHGHLLEMR